MEAKQRQGDSSKLAQRRAEHCLSMLLAFFELVVVLFLFSPLPVAKSFHQSPVSLGRFPKTERGKRLELLRTILQDANQEYPAESWRCSDAVGHAAVKSCGFPIEKVQVWAEELDEVVCAWPMIDESVQRGLIAIARAQSCRSVRR